MKYISIHLFVSLRKSTIRYHTIELNYNLIDLIQRLQRFTDNLFLMYFLKTKLQPKI